MESVNVIRRELGPTLIQWSNCAKVKTLTEETSQKSVLVMTNEEFWRGVINDNRLIRRIVGGGWDKAIHVVLLRDQVLLIF